MDFSRQVERMVAFMDQEGIEKAQEVDAKTEEEYNIYIGQTVQSERIRINTHFEKLEAGIEKQKIVAQSIAGNNARLHFLNLKEEIMDEVFKAAVNRVTDNLNNKQQYKTVMNGLLLQAALKLAVPKLLVRVIQHDVREVKSCLSSVTNAYYNMTKAEVRIDVDERNFLPATVIGGVEVYDRMGKAKVSNTLKNRITLIRNLLMPVVRCELFGLNPRRKFYT